MARGGSDRYHRPVTSTDREILRLAVPAFLALVAEPLFLLSDAAIIGHLGTTELAGLGIAGVVLQTSSGCASSSPTAPPPASRDTSAPATSGPPSPRASTAAGSRS